MRRRFRLRQHSEIEAVRRSGRRQSNSLAVLLYRPNSLADSRFAFSAGRRIGNAVARNRAKRLLREAVRLHLDQIESGWDCLFIVRNATPTASFDEVRAAVLQLLKRAHLIDASSTN